jgi:hypothetical protein
MVPLPTRDLEGAHHVAGDYGDAAAAASQGLFARLRMPNTSAQEIGTEEEAAEGRGPLMMPPLAGTFWTEHSERNAMPTAAAALGLGDEVVRRLGRWQTGQATELYVRSTVSIAMDAQKRVAKRVRGGGRDFLGEEAVLCKLERYLREKGLAEGVIEETRRHLTHFGEGDRLEEPGSEGTAPTEPYDEEGPEVAPRDDSTDADEGEAAEGLTGYVVSIVGRKQYRRLHHLTKCGLIPGRDYREYVIYGSTLPPPDSYDSICTRCWRSRSAFDAEGQLSLTGPRSATSSGESGAS